MQLHYLNLGLSLFFDDKLNASEFAALQMIILRMQTSPTPNTLSISTSNAKKLMNLSRHSFLQGISKLSALGLIQADLTHNLVTIRLCS